MTDVTGRSAGKNWRLIYEGSRLTVRLGDSVEGREGDLAIVEGGAPPQHEGSTGRVYVQENGTQRAYFPSVFGLQWEVVK